MNTATTAEQDGVHCDPFTLESAETAITITVCI